MGKVLIALCTVFLLAFPARGEQTVTWESLTVWNDLPPLYDPAPWPSDLAGKRVILRWNGKHNGDLLLDYLHSLLSRAFPDTEFIKAYETEPRPQRHLQGSARIRGHGAGAPRTAP